MHCRLLFGNLIGHVKHVGAVHAFRPFRVPADGVVATARFAVAGRAIRAFPQSVFFDVDARATAAATHRIVGVAALAILDDVRVG